MYKSGRSASRGFTLVELVLVMIIGGVLAAVAVPRMVDRSAYQTRGGASEVRTALRYAQRLAMAKNREVCVTTTANDLTLMFTPVPGPACSEFVTGPDGVIATTYTVTLPTGITPGVAFRFDGQGRPITLPPNTQQTLVVGGAGGTGTVTVQPTTGYVQ